ncbi:MAG TPA: helicase C-terminal domain-containing protein, partial [Limnochorda sp.]
SGKTLVGEAVRRLLGEPAIYLCTTRSLQRQFLRDFPYAALLMGRGNYPTLDYPHITAEDCNKRKVGDRVVCSWCHMVSRCPYEVAKAKALGAPVAVLNTAYYLTEVNHVGRFGDRSLVIVDEADELESEIMRLLEVRLSARLLKALNVGFPEHKTHPEDWDRWLQEQVIPALEPYAKELQREAERRPKDLALQRQARSAARTLQAVRRVAGNLSAEQARWVYVDPERSDDGSVTFKPVRVDQEAPSFVWRHAQRWLLMSATIISASQLAADLGLEGDQWRFVRVPSTFPRENRPIYVPLKDIPAVTRKTAEADWPRLVEALDRILDAYPDERVLVHTVSYALARYVAEHSRHRGRLIRYDQAADRDLALAAFRERPGAVLVAPSMERGIDLPDDEARVVVVLKIPYPALDKQVATRVYGTRGGETWYRVQTVRRLVQMTGRAVRSETDWAHTYILDAQFLELRKKARGLFPRWWEEAVIFTGEVVTGGRAGSQEAAG